MISNTTRSRLEALLRVVTNTLNRALAERSVIERLAGELANNAPPARLENVVRRRIAFYMACLAADMRMLLPIDPYPTSLYDHLLSRQRDRPRLKPDTEPSRPIPIPQKPGSRLRHSRSPSRGTTPPTSSSSYAEEPPAESLVPKAQGSILIGGGTPSPSSSSSDEDVPTARKIERPLIRDLLDHSATVEMMLDQDHARLVQFLRHHVMEVESVVGSWEAGLAAVVQGVVLQMVRATMFLADLQMALKGYLRAHVSDYDSKSSSESPSPERRPRRVGFFSVILWLLYGWCSK